jgi:hypothetical protein
VGRVAIQMHLEMDIVAPEADRIQIDFPFQGLTHSL